MCPIQYSPLTTGVDDTWLFALNYAAAKHMVLGRDIVWTSGPLGYLAYPMDIGNNLAQGLFFQAILWIVLLAVLWDLLFRSGLSLRNLVLFTWCIALSSFMYHDPPNPLGAADLILLGVLILLVHYRLRGGIGRYLAGLLMLGFIPLINFVGVLLAVGLIAGLSLSLIVERETAAWPTIALALVVPTAVIGLGYWITLGSLQTFLLYLKGSMQLSQGYNLAMSLSGRTIEIPAGIEIFVILGVAFVLLTISNRPMSKFLVFVLAVPVFLNFKHAFVRQDTHIIYAFCFVASAVGIMALAASLQGERLIVAWVVPVLVLSILCQDYAVPNSQGQGLAALTGYKTPAALWGAVHFEALRHTLQVMTEQEIPEAERPEPEIAAIVGHLPVGSLSIVYTDVYAAGLNLQLYPVVQRYSAYTPYLDELNAEWIRDRGPRFLLYKEISIDDRHPWTESPAMWLEVYRWYDTRLLGARNLLLERRVHPRLEGFVPMAHQTLGFGQPLFLPGSAEAAFWTASCHLNTAGKLRALLFRVPEVTMTLEDNGKPRTYRALLGVLGSPTMGSYLPTNLTQFAEVFRPLGTPDFRVHNFFFDGPGKRDYEPICEFELLRPAE